jgi:glutaredoxin 3
MMAKVVMYATEWCPYCRRAEALLRAKGAELEKIDVDAQPERRSEMQRRSRRRTVPQIWIGEMHIGGCDELHDLDRQGRLDPLLAAA